MLASCYERAIELAADHDCFTVAFPAISTGAFGYPLADAALIAVTTTKKALNAHPTVKEARFWLFDQHAYDVFSARLDS